MSTFKRGLDRGFVDAFNEEYEKGGWLKGLVDDKDVFLAIRENSVNFYHRGCSLLKLDWKGGAMTGEVHYKYLLRPDLPNPYVRVRVGDGSPDLPDGLFLDSLSDVESLKKAVQPHAGGEKSGVHDILAANNNILDVEIAFGGGGRGEPGPSAPRVDFAAMRPDDGGAEIVFFEAKHFDNHSALRARGDNPPKVIKQMEAYARKLDESRDAVRESYARICHNLSCLSGVAARHPERHAVLERIRTDPGSLRIDTNPVLIVFGFDDDQRTGTSWGPHLEKLKNLLDGRVHLKGKSKEFVRGISV